VCRRRQFVTSGTDKTGDLRTDRELRRPKARTNHQRLMGLRSIAHAGVAMGPYAKNMARRIKALARKKSTGAHEPVQKRLGKDGKVRRLCMPLGSRAN
jgi:hypothetical protein